MSDVKPPSAMVVRALLAAGLTEIGVIELLKEIKKNMRQK